MAVGKWVTADRRGVELGDDGLLGGAEIAAPLDRSSLSRAGSGRPRIGQAREGLRDRLERLGIALERLELEPPLGQDPLHDEQDEVLAEADDVLEGGEGHLGLDHPELDEVAAGLRLLGPEGRAEAVDLAEGHGRGLVVELAALAEVGLLVEVLGLEQGRRPLAGARRQDGRVHEPEAAAVEEVADGLDDLGPDTQDGVLLRGPEPEVAVLHQERGAVLLERDRVFRRDLDDLELGHRQLEAARGALVGPDPAPDDEGGFLGQAVELLKEQGVLVGAEGRGLDEAGPVADEQEADLARRTLVVDPAPDLDVPAVVRGDILDVDPIHNGLIIRHNQAICAIASPSALVGSLRDFRGDHLRSLGKFEDAALRRRTRRRRVGSRCRANIRRYTRDASGKRILDRLFRSLGPSVDAH